ncbi:MAG: hypothetical protein LH478_10290, partial [Chitinophagaceae bacterium]|nr:hypothetical protein [Chitinophagaceae bacterium]
MVSGLSLTKLSGALEQKGCNNILMLLKEGVSEKQPGKGQRHKVFEESFDVKPVYHKKFPEQKINYIQLNPVREYGGWLNIGRTMNTAV